MKKILIIRFSSIGDIVLTTPVVRVLKQQLGAEIHYLTKASFKSVLEANPYIDTLICIQKEVHEVMRQLKSNQYDLIIDLHKNLRSLRVKNALGVKSYAFDKINVQKWLMVNFKFNRLPEFHIVDRYLATTTSLGVQNDGKGLDYFIPKKDEVDLGTALPTSHKNYIAFVIGAALATKRLPNHKIIAICKAINQPIILLGGPAEKATGAIIAEDAGAHVINCCGGFNLNQSASLVQQAEVVISHDTGLMHIAAAFRKRIISIWGNTIPEFGMYPYYGSGEDLNTTVEVSNLACRPCSKIGYASCPKGHFKCMEEIDVARIAHLI